MELVLFNRIGAILVEKGLEQKDLAEMTGLTPNTISDMVRNVRSTINREHLGKVASALGITDPRELLFFASPNEVRPDKGRCLSCQQPVLPEFGYCSNCEGKFDTHLRELEDELEAILNSDLPPLAQHDRISVLMTLMEKEFRIPLLKNHEWEKCNPRVYGLYYKMSQSRPDLY